MKIKKIISIILIASVTINALCLPVVAKENNNQQTTASVQDAKSKYTREYMKSKYPNLTYADAKEIKPVEFSDKTLLELNDIIKLMNEANDEYSMDKLQKAYDKFFKLYPTLSEEDVNKHKEYDQIDYINTQGIYLAFYLSESDNNMRNKFLQKYADDIFIAMKTVWNKSFQKGFLTEYITYVYTKLGTYVPDSRTQYLLSLSEIMCKGFDDCYDKDGKPQKVPEEKKPSIMKDIPIPSNEKGPTPGKIHITDDKRPENEKHQNPENNKIIPNPGSNLRFSGNFDTVEYKAEGNRCYQYTTKHEINSNKTSTNKVLLPKSQNGFCNISNETDIPGNEWNNTHNGNIALQIWTSLAENELNKLNDNTLQFTVNKNENNPYYFDSGIRLSKDNTATFNQIKDVLEQLTEKTKAYVVEDSNKFMFVAEGKPLIVLDKDKEYSIQDISSLLDSFKTVGLKVDKIKTNQGTPLTNVNDGTLTSIKFKDTTIKLTHNPILSNDTLQLPVEEVAKAIGYTVTSKDNKLILQSVINGQKVKVEYNKDSKDITVNNQQKIMSTKSQMKNDVLYADMNLAVKAIGYDLDYDTNNGTITIE